MKNNLKASNYFNCLLETCSAKCYFCPFAKDSDDKYDFTRTYMHWPDEKEIAEELSIESENCPLLEV